MLNKWIYKIYITKSIVNARDEKKTPRFSQEKDTSRPVLCKAQHFFDHKIKRQWRKPSALVPTRWRHNQSTSLEMYSVMNRSDSIEILSLHDRTMRKKRKQNATDYYNSFLRVDKNKRQSGRELAYRLTPVALDRCGVFRWELGEK